MVKNGFSFPEDIKNNNDLRLAKRAAAMANIKIDKKLKEKNCNVEELLKDKERINYFINTNDIECLEYLLFVSSRYVNKEDLELKRFEELQEGKCIVVYKSNDTQKESEGSYNKSFNLVFMCIPENAKILGYLQ
ncbi:hypothetical protein ACSW9O_15220 (plasmid) [Clostridium perfringens]|nr:hypothetical protein [Clostridium perfringens]